MRLNKSLLKLVLGEGDVALLKGQKVKPQRLLDLGFPFQFSDINAMLDDLI